MKTSTSRRYGWSSTTRICLATARADARAMPSLRSRGIAGLRAGARVWTGQRLADVAVYVADGRAMALPLLADGLIHDWNFILGRLGLLYAAESLGRLTFGLGALAMLAALGLLGWTAWTRMLSSQARNRA